MGTPICSWPLGSTGDKLGGDSLVRAESLPSEGCANPD